MSDLLTNGLSGLLAFQRAIATTGHNIANANTEGYSRQRVLFGSRPPEFLGSQYIGTGTQIIDTSRLYDQLLGVQLREANSSFSRAGQFGFLATQLDNLLADSQSGLDGALNSFFASVQDVANDPSSTATRQLLIDDAQGLIDRFRFIDGRLNDLEAQVNGRIQSGVTEINTFAQQIADLNEQIVSSGGGVAPSDLLDKRDLLVQQLSEVVGLQVAERNDGAINVFTGSGQTLVQGTIASQLNVAASPYSVDRLEIYQSGSNVPLTDSLSGGQLGGALDFRREMLDPARNMLGRVAIGIGMEFNAMHRQGMDLDGALGGDFFALPAPTVLPNAANTGGALPTATVSDVSALTDQDYVLGYDGAVWGLRNANGGALIPMTGSGTVADPFVADGLSIVVGAGALAGDRFLIRPTRGASAGLDPVIADPRSIAAAAPIRTSAANANIGDGQISAGVVLDETDPGLLSPVTIQFLSPNTYSVNGAGVFAYTDGADIDINGWRIQISGAPAVGDQFEIQSNAGGVGDNRNMLNLANLTDRGVLSGGSASLQQSYGQLVASTGSLTAQAQINESALAVVRNNAQTALDSVSGVNLDEEAANLLRFEQAYAAAAQAVAVADTLFQTLLGAVRR